MIESAGMNGGKYDRAYFNIMEFSIALENDLLDPNKGSRLPPKCKAELNKIVRDAKQLSLAMKNVGLLLSGDIGEDAFLEELPAAPPRPAVPLAVLNFLRQDPQVPEILIPHLWKELENLPILETSSSLHIYECKYVLDGYTYSALWELSSSDPIPSAISFKKNNK